MSSDNDTNQSATVEAEDETIQNINEDSGLDIPLNQDLLSVPSQSTTSSGRTSPEDDPRPTSVTDSQSSSSSLMPPRDDGSRPSSSSGFVQSSSLGFSGSIPSIELSASVDDPTSTGIVVIPEGNTSISGGLSAPESVPSSSITSPSSSDFQSSLGFSGSVPSIELSTSIEDSPSTEIVAVPDDNTSSISLSAPQSISSSLMTSPIEPLSGMVSSAEISPRTEELELSEVLAKGQEKVPSRPTSIVGVGLRRTYHEFSKDSDDGILQSKPFEHDLCVKKIKTSDQEDPPTTVSSTSSASLSTPSSGETLSTSLSTTYESKDTTFSSITAGSSETPEDSTRADVYRIMRTKGPRIRISDDPDAQGTESFQSTPSSGATDEDDQRHILPLPEDIYFQQASPSIREEQVEDMEISGTNQDDGNKNQDA